MSKMEKVIRILEEKQADAILVHNRYSMRYISGYCGDTGVLYLSKNKKVLYTDFRYIYQAIAEAKDFEVVDIADKGYAGSIAETVFADGAKKICFEGGEVIYSSYSKLREKLEGVELIPIDDELSDIRIYKTADEIANIRQAEHIGDLVFTEMLDFIKPGMTELEIAARIEYGLKKNGAEGNSFDPIVASGVNSSMPHAVPSRKVIEKGDFLTMDFGCTYNGYCSDMTRTIVIGKASDKQKEIYNIVLEAQLAAIDAAKPGITGKALDAVARDIIAKASYGDCFGHGLGHGVGLYIHEGPRAAKMNEKALEAGMTVTIEPGIYVKDFGGVRIEDLLVLNEKGHENLTFSPKELIEL